MLAEPEQTYALRRDGRLMPAGALICVLPERRTMGYTKKTLEKMDVMDDFLMGQLASDEEFGKAFCRRILSTLLQKKIGRLNIRAQKMLPAVTPHLRGIRIDVEVEELEDMAEGEEPAVMNVYDLEPHLQRNLNLPRHNRFYQAKIDSRGMKSGETDFDRLPNLYVLTILSFDPFGKDRMVYTVRNKCEEEPELEYEDGLRFYYFYTNGSKGGNEALKTMLTYMQDSREENATDEATKEIHSYVSRVKVLPEVRQAYMRYEEIIYYERKEAAVDTRIQDILELLKDYGEVPEHVRKRLLETDDPEILKKWLKIAARADSVEEFARKISEC